MYAVFRVKIKTKILIILLTLVGLVSFSLLFSQYYFSEKLAMKSTSETFSIISKDIQAHIQNEAEITHAILNTKSQYKDIEEKITFTPKHAALDGFIQILQLKKNLHAIYMAHENGHFYEVVNMHNRPMLYETLEAPLQTYWTVITIIDKIQQKVFLDKYLHIIDKKRSAVSYDPSLRNWYIDAQRSPKVISTMPYFFAHIREMGITYAKKVPESGTVLAIDYTMKQLNSILEMQKTGSITEIFLVDDKGYKFASSNTYEYANNMKSGVLKTKLLQAILDKRTNEIIKYNFGKEKRYVIFRKLLHEGTYLGIKVDAYALLKLHRESIKYSLAIALLLLLLSIPIILLSVKNITKPIYSLVDENNKITERKFSEVKQIDTNIIEFEALSNSMVSMSQSIQKHAQAQDALLDSIIKLIAEAIDSKSAYTGKHCERVPQIAQLLLDAANKSESGIFKSFLFDSKDDLRAFEIGAWLHDCGKVTTPEFVVDKSVKLEMIYNRIHEIRMRFEVLWRDLQIAYLKNEITKEILEMQQQQLREDFEFIASINMGTEFMSEEKKTRVQEIAKKQWLRYFNDTLGLSKEEEDRYDAYGKESIPSVEHLLSDKVEHIVLRDDFDPLLYEKEGFKLEVPEYLYNYGEVYNLCIEKGTLTKEERYKINEHVIMSIKMLDKIPFPDTMKHIVEYAGTHHETLIGTGYPRKLSKEDLSIPARIMAIADIFEALTASDRPYKKAKTVSEAVKIMYSMVKDQHIDRDLFELFLTSGVYKAYAEAYLDEIQIDEVDIGQYIQKEVS